MILKLIITSTLSLFVFLYIFSIAYAKDQYGLSWGAIAAETNCTSSSTGTPGTWGNDENTNSGVPPIFLDDYFAPGVSVDCGLSNSSADAFVGVNEISVQSKSYGELYCMIYTKMELVTQTQKQQGQQWGSGLHI